MILFNNISADDTSDAFESQGGPAIVNVRGDNYGGGTVNIEFASANDPSDPDRFAVLTDGALTADASIKIDYMPVGSKLRAVLAGATAPVNVFVDVLQ